MSLPAWSPLVAPSHSGAQDYGQAHCSALLHSAQPVRRAPAWTRRGYHPVIDRRTFLAGASAVLLATPLVAQAQQGASIPRVGFLSPSALSDPRTSRYFQALRRGLREQGYVEGQNIAVEARWAEGKYDRLPGLAAELVRLKVTVIVTYGGVATEAAKQAT